MMCKRDTKIKRLTHKNIKPYGCIIDSEFLRDDGRGDKFGVLLKERSPGWRIGYLILRKRRIERLERHRDSLETLEPVSGKAAIALAKSGSPQDYEVFLLNKPVCLKKGVWHDVASLSKESGMKIFENAQVSTEYRSLDAICAITKEMTCLCKRR